MPPDVVQKLSYIQTAALDSMDSEYVKQAARVGGCLTPNLAKDTEDFTAATWTPQNSTPSANADYSPRGDKTAGLIVENSATDIHNVISTDPGGAIAVTTNAYAAVSIYAKPKERTWLVLGFQDTGGGGASGQAFYDVGNGLVGSAVGSGLTIVETAIEAAANGFFRCKLVAKRLSGTTIQMYHGPALGDNGDVYAGDGASGIYVWGAQAEDQASLVHCYAVQPVVLKQFVEVSPEDIATAAYNLAQAMAAEDARRNV